MEGYKMEIERKFLVKEVPKALQNYKRLEIRQGYISTSPVIRLRKSCDDYFITFKGGSGNIMRDEFEYPLTKEQFDGLWLKTEHNVIIKDRYIIPIGGGLLAELDIYHENLNGLVTVEVEFESIEQAESFLPPSWFGEDVSEDRRYKNSWLCVHGLQTD